MKNDEFPIQPYTIKQLAAVYNCSTWTFRKWLAPIQPTIGERVGHFYTPSQVRIIVAHLGPPSITFFALFAEVLVRVAEAMFGVDYADHYQADSRDQENHSEDTSRSSVDHLDAFDYDEYGTTLIT